MGKNSPERNVKGRKNIGGYAVFRKGCIRKVKYLGPASGLVIYPICCYNNHGIMRNTSISRYFSNKET